MESQANSMDWLVLARDRWISRPRGGLPAITAAIAMLLPLPCLAQPATAQDTGGPQEEMTEVAPPIDTDGPTDHVAITVEALTARRAHSISTGSRERGVPVILGDTFITHRLRQHNMHTPCSPTTPAWGGLAARSLR